MTQLQMLRPRLDDLPDLPSERSWSLESLVESRLGAVSRLLVQGFDDEWNVERCRQEFLSGEGTHVTYLLVEDGHTVATATAQRSKQPRHDVGFIHMVSADPERKGRGFGKWAVLAALHGLRSFGYRAAALTTDDHRLPAIVTYLRLGFEPESIAEDHEERWQKVHESIAK